MDASPSIDAARRKRLLNQVVLATVAVQVAIVMASLTVPVLASAIAPAVGVPAYWVGYYAALIYGFAALTSFVTPRLFRRWGGIRLHQGMVVMVAAALALVMLLPGFPAAFAASGIVLGVAYGPMNPASTVLLTRYTPSHLRSRVFSFKQTAVPLGGALAGLVMPLITATLGWRGAILVIAAVCLALTALIEPCRSAIDDDAPGHDRDLSIKFWMPLRLIAQNAGIRSAIVAAFAFGSLQFSFVAMFPTVLAHIGWSTTDAGRAMSVALLVGVILRVPWGTAADKIGPRPILAAMGVTMSLSSVAACFLGPGWPAMAVVLLAAVFGLSAFCWSGIGIAEAVRHAPPALVPEASAGIIGVTFLGALAGPMLFSSVAALAGTVVPAFAILGALAAVGVGLLLRGPRRGECT